MYSCGVYEKQTFSILLTANTFAAVLVADFFEPDLSAHSIFSDLIYCWLCCGAVLLCCCEEMLLSVFLSFVVLAQTLYVDGTALGAAEACTYNRYANRSSTLYPRERVRERGTEGDGRRAQDRCLLSAHSSISTSNILSFSYHLPS